MPYLLIQTNCRPDRATAERLIDQAAKGAAEMLGKPERYVMVALMDGVQMRIAGTAEPTVYMEMKSIGLPEARTGAFSHRLTDLVRRELGVAPDRVYIEFSDVEPSRWGWNAATF